ncbi:unnamed protein product [Caenorhabditis bovis]|uniref:Kinase n=1 Tax=Caenorhabditis bovis TaxID=2654633 RepID=A0A8S1EZ80_9PELO|nr:unnamed protein product [Caenorhabditis bovis]
MHVSNDGLPANYQWFSDQIAGHHPSVIKNGKREIGLLKSPGSKEILKPKQDAARGLREVAIYRTLSSEVTTTLPELRNEFSGARKEDVTWMRRLTPKYFGLTQLHVDDEDHEFLILEDVTAEYKLPAILDLKMGQVTYDPLASPEKIEKESRKYPPQANVGCRILGYRIHNEDGDVEVRDKDWGKSFNEDTIKDGLKEFFNARPECVSKVVEEAKHALKDIEAFFESQRSFMFFASSLLFVYETSPDLPINLRIVMIDFSHAFASNGSRDEGYLFGIKNLFRFLNEIQKSP